MSRPTRTTASLNVLSNKNNPMQAQRPTKAQKYFQQTAILPKSINNEMFLATNNPDINGRPAKPVQSEVISIDENDPFSQIERCTYKIGNLMTNYEEQVQQDHYTMLQELDSNFQINNFDPKEILVESRKTVDGLMDKTKVLKETQVGMLGDLSTWFQREEQSLKDADVSSNVTVDISVPVTTDDLLSVLNSSAGTSQDRVTKAIALHGDIVSRAFLAIHQLERKNHEQENLITDLKRQVTELAPKSKKRTNTQNNSDLQKQLQTALSRISSQEDTIKRLNERIEQLIGQSVLQKVNSEKTGFDESIVLKAHDMLSLELQIDKQESLIQSLKDEIYSLKHDIKQLEADKSFLESQGFTYSEKLEMEKMRYETLQKQFLDMINDQQDSNGERKENPLLGQIVNLEAEIKKLREQIDSERKMAHSQLDKRVKELRREFEVREMELKKRQLGNSLAGGGSHQAVYEALQNQHDNEMAILKKNYEDQISELKRGFEDERANLEKDFASKLKDFQKQLQMRALAAGGPETANYIDALQKQYDAKEEEIKKTYMKKMDEQREDFKKHLMSLEAEVKAKEDEIRKLMTKIEEMKISSFSDDDDENKNNKNNTYLNENQQKSGVEEEDYIDQINEKIAEIELDNSLIPIDIREQINNALAKYAQKMEQKFRNKMYDQKQKIDAFWQQQMKEAEDRLNFELNSQQEESGIAINNLNNIVAELEGKLQAQLNGDSDSQANKIEAIRAEFLDQINRANEIIGQNKKLQVENELLKAQIAKGTDDFSVIELTQALAEQTSDLNDLKERYEKLQQKFIDTEKKLQAEKEENAKLQKKKNYKKMVIYDFVYSDIFTLSTELKKDTPIAQIEVPHMFRKYFEINTSIEPRLQEHVKRTKAKPRVDGRSFLYFENRDNVSIEFSEPIVIKDSYNNNNNNENDDFINYRNNSTNNNTKNNSNYNKNKLYVSPMRLFAINEDSKMNEPIVQYITKADTKRKIELKYKHYDGLSLFTDKNKNVKMQKNRLVFDLIPFTTSILSLAFPMKFGIEPLNDDQVEELRESARKAVKTKSSVSSFLQVPQLLIQKQNPLYLSNINTNEKCSMDVAVQVKIENMPEITLRSPLSQQPPIEIFGIMREQIRPEDPVILDPSAFNNRRRLRKNNGEIDSGSDLLDSKREIQLLTKSGDLIDIPPIQNIDSKTDIEATKLVTKMTLSDAEAMTNKLDLVINELQMIDQEPDPSKRMQLQETLGVTLDVEKDSIISQMRERITELEQMMNRVATDESQGEKSMSQFASIVSISPENSVLSTKEINFDINSDQGTTNIVGEVNVNYNSTKTGSFASSGIQTDPVEIEAVGTTTMDFSSPEDVINGNEFNFSENQTETRNKFASNSLDAVQTVVNVEPKSSKLNQPARELTFSTSETQFEKQTKSQTQPLQIVTSHQVIENIPPSQKVLKSETAVSPMPSYRATKVELESDSLDELQTQTQTQSLANLKTIDNQNFNSEKVFDIDILTPVQILEMPETVDLSTEFGILFKKPPKYANHSQIVASSITIRNDENDINEKNNQNNSGLYNKDDINKITNSNNNDNNNNNNDNDYDNDNNQLEENIENKNEYAIRPALFVSGKIECDYGYIQPLTLTKKEEQFSERPKKKPALYATEISHEIQSLPIGERSTSPFDISKPKLVDIGISHSSEKVREGPQLNIANKENDVNGNQRVKLNVENVKSAVRNDKSSIFSSIVTKGLIDIKPRNDPKVSQIQDQMEQISTLKKQLLQLQLSDPKDMPKIISTMRNTMSTISENMDEINNNDETGGGSSAIIVPVNNSNNKGKIKSFSSLALLREALETTDGIAESMINNQTSVINSQNSLFNRIKEATKNFLREMDKPGGAPTEKQSNFLREINDISTEFAQTLSDLQAELDNDKNMKVALLQAKEQLLNQEKLLDLLQKENLDLKLGLGKSNLVQTLVDIKNEIENMTNDKLDENSLIKSETDAIQIVPKIATKGKNDNNAQAAGASPLLERVAKMSMAQRPDWRSIAAILDEAIGLIEEHDAKQKARGIIDGLNIEIKALQSDNQRLQTDLIIAERDLQVAKDKLNAQIRQLQQSLETANEHARILERQIGTHQVLQKSMEAEATVKTLENELEFSRHSDQQHLKELQDANRRLAEMENEGQRLQEELTKTKERYLQLFGQATDTQTANDTLRTKTEEILQKAEISQQRADAMDRIRESIAKQADDLASQLSESIFENARLQNLAMRAEQKIAQLENELLAERANKAIIQTTSYCPPTSSSATIGNSTSNFTSNSQMTSSSFDAPKVIKAYQQRIEQYMNLLMKHGNDLIELRARHATDQKSLIMMQRENRRAQNELKMQQLRYDCVKKELAMLQKALGARDETILALKREIERLRSLLAMQAMPLRQKIALFDKEKNDAELQVLTKQKEVEQTQQQRDKFGTKNPNVSNYYEGLLVRQQATLARLEKKRREMREIEEKNRLATLRAVSQVVQMAELQLPEQYILKMMPKPQPVRRLALRQSQIEEQKRYERKKDEDLMREVGNIKESSRRYPSANNIAVSNFASSRAIAATNTPTNGTVNTTNDPAKYYGKTPSYADTLQMIGQLVGQKSPRTLQEMLRNARHNRIVIPVQTNAQKRQKETVNVLSIRPMRK